MSTPSKNLVKYAEIMPSMREMIKSSISSAVEIEKNFDDVIKYREAPEKVFQGHRRLLKILNRLLEVERKMEDLITSESAVVRQAFLFGEEEMKGSHRPDQLTIDTGLAHKAPKLTPRVGYAEAMKRLNLLRPRKGDDSKITIRQLAGCLGQVGSESHIV